MAQKKQPLDHLRSQKKPMRATVWIAGDSELAAEVQEMEEDLRQRESSLRVRGDRATEAEVSSVTELRGELSTKRADLRKTSIPFVMESLGVKRFEALVLEHPATEQQVKDAEGEGIKGLQWNPETFPLALIDACTVEPEHEPGQILEWLQDETAAWNSMEIQELFQAALKANLSRGVVSLGKD